MTLLLSQSDRISKDELKKIETPSATATWIPVPHYDLAVMIGNEAVKRGYEVVSEEYGLSKDNSKMFGVIRFHPHGHPEYTRALGIRNSHDKTLPVGLVAGLSILVCDNLCFGGAAKIQRKHTSGIDLIDLIPNAFDAIDQQYVKLETRVNELKRELLSIDEAKLVTVRAAEMKAIPSCDIIPVLKEFKNPQHDSFRYNNAWSLYNAFTETAKKYSSPRADLCYKVLGDLFRLA